MRLFLAVMVAVSLSLVFITCDKDTGTNSGNLEKITAGGSDLVKVQVDLVQGFENYPVLIEFDHEIYFYTYLSNFAPLAGPLATFTTYLLRGSNQCKVLWGGQGSGTTFHIDSTYVSFGNLEKYYMYISVYNDSLDVRIQENPVGYL